MPTPDTEISQTYENLNSSAANSAKAEEDRDEQSQKYSSAMKSEN